MLFFEKNLNNGLMRVKLKKNSLFLLKKNILPFFKVQKAFSKNFLKIKQFLLSCRKFFYFGPGFLNVFYRRRIRHQFFYMIRFLKQRLKFSKKFFPLKKKRIVPRNITFGFFENNVFSKTGNFIYNFKLISYSFFFNFAFLLFFKFRNVFLKNQYTFLNHFISLRKRELLELENFFRLRVLSYLPLGLSTLSFLLYKQKRNLQHKSVFSNVFLLKKVFFLFWWKKINKFHKRLALKSFPKKHYFRKRIDRLDRKYQLFLNKKNDNKIRGSLKKIDKFFFELRPLSFNRFLNGIIKEKRCRFFFDKEKRNQFFFKSKEFFEFFGLKSLKKNFYFTGKKSFLFRYFVSKNFFNVIKKKLFFLPKKNQSKIFFFLKKEGGRFWQKILGRCFKFSKKKKKKIGFYAKARLFSKKKKKINEKLISSINDKQFFVNCIMENGNKEKALRIFLKAYFLFAKEVFIFLNIKKKQNPIYFFKKAIADVIPPLVLIQKSIAGKKQKIPYVAKLERRRRIAIRWIVLSAKNSSVHKDKPFFFKLAFEMLDILKKKGSSLKKKKEYTDEYAKGRFFIRRLKIV